MATSKIMTSGGGESLDTSQCEPFKFELTTSGTGQSATKTTTHKIKYIVMQRVSLASNILGYWESVIDVTNSKAGQMGVYNGTLQPYTDITMASLGVTINSDTSFTFTNNVGVPMNYLVSCFY